MAGVNHQVEWFSEIKRAPSIVFSQRFGVSNLGDLTHINNPPQVDIITSGFPCQPHSVAGLNKGVDDERFLIDDVCRVASTSGARWLVLENVPQILTSSGGRSMSRVCEAMASEGFVRWEWGTVRASDVGACHQRRRWFCIAATADADGITAGWDVDWPLGTEAPREDESPVSHRDGPSNAPAADPRSAFGEHLAAVQRWESVIGRPAPEPLCQFEGQEILSPAFTEWAMGLPERWVTGVEISLPQMLGTIGNGVVPQQAAAEIRRLAIALERQCS